MTDPRSLYQSKVASGALRPDADQAHAIERLQNLHERLRAEKAAPSEGHHASWFGRLLGNHQPDRRASAPGIYLQGSVGRGKSVVMDLFAAASAGPNTRRVHFHAFMLEVQKRLHELRQRGVDDAIGTLARDIAAQTELLCFDEFHVVDIGDAMILGRLFTGLFDAGVTVVATSNWLPERLYWNGLNRERFLPFIELLTSKVELVTLDGQVDYRIERMRDLHTWFSPLDEAAAAAVARLFSQLADGNPGEPMEISVGSRSLKVPRAHGPVAAFDFPELCARALGAADYLAIGERFRVVFLTDVPLLSPARRNEMRRFMTLIDALYECRRMLVVSAAGQPDQLYPSGEGAFEFQRTVSRLMEMQSSGWLDQVRASSGQDMPMGFAPFALTSDLI